MAGKKSLLIVLSLILFSSCGIINIRKSGGSAEMYSNYSEDLSSTRIQFEPLPDPEDSNFEPEGDADPIDQELGQRINQIIMENDKEMFLDGFTILVYSGVGRDAAFELRNEVYSEFPDIQTYMEYEQPRYLVKVGRYINKIEALATYEKLKPLFPGSRIISARFLKDHDQQKKEEEKIENAER
ncbi:hypothetical protein [Cyclobacterium jeungdonense]|uniref:SPOR domain-containing protein n=1 Tax=Cyclobacterium jeungdonense TaxID=708087 RepID=A0ABT8C575_9BACT|nr:hypothetical protein [Cyclobacterium jeungdonense]MDN3687620.1 hypothetical protein [Cyclobacterium jeungdonense]